jgi:2Fe-2S ferredoxin
MPKVTFIKDGKETTVEFEHGKLEYSHHGLPESFLDLAMNLGIPLEHACGGSCACTTCHLFVKKGSENLSEAQDNELDRLDTAWDLRPNSRLGCQAIIKGDVVVEFPLYTRNYVQEAVRFSSASPIVKTKRRGELVKWTDSEDIGIALFEKFPSLDPLTVRFTDLREKVMGLDGFDDDAKTSNEPKLEAIQMAWYEEWKEGQ